MNTQLLSLDLRLPNAIGRDEQISSRGKGEAATVIIAVVWTNDKQRFAFSANGSRIRANQGLSLQVDLGLVPVEPPELLYHGTVPRFLDSIRRDGLTKGMRHHVHLSPDIQTATRVDQRCGLSSR